MKKNKNISQLQQINIKTMYTIHGGNRTNQTGGVTGNGGSAPGQLIRLPRGFDLNGLPF